MKYEAVSNKDRAKPSAHIEMHDTKDVYGNNVGREVEDVFFFFLQGSSLSEKKPLVPY